MESNNLSIIYIYSYTYSNCSPRNSCSTRTYTTGYLLSEQINLLCTNHSHFMQSISLLLITTSLVEIGTSHISTFSEQPLKAI